MTWNEWIDMNDLTWMNCDEWVERNEVPKVLLSFWRFLSEIALSLQSCAHFVDLIFKKWSEPVSFLRSYVINCLMTMWLTCEIELSLQSRPHFGDLIFQKWPGPVSFLRFYLKSSSRCSLVHVLWTTFSDRGAHPQRHRPSSNDHGRPLYAKKKRVLRPRVLSSVNSRLPYRSHLRTTWWWCGWHMLTFWCGCHDDWDDDVVAVMVRQLAFDNRP